MEYSRNYLVHYYEIDSKRRLTLPALIHYFEDIAILNSEQQGFTLDYYEKNHCGWMLFKWDVKIHRYPVFNESIKINTRPTAFKNFFGNREYDIFSADGQLIVEAKSLWILADTQTRRPLRVPDEMYIGFDTKKEDETKFNKLDELEAISDGEFRRNISVHESDIDTNNHVNNVRYVEWVMESLPREFLSSNYVTGIKVNYKKELNLGEEASVISSINSSGDKINSRHSICFSGKEFCNLEMEWLKEEINE
ncbi:MAG: acyl-ACP thioesterase domain-containing protein [bacterium]